jgi:hypothetical protein
MSLNVLAAFGKVSQGRLVVGDQACIAIDVDHLAGLHDGRVRELSWRSPDSHCTLGYRVVSLLDSLGELARFPWQVGLAESDRQRPVCCSQQHQLQSIVWGFHRYGTGMAIATGGRAARSDRRAGGDIVNSVRRWDFPGHWSAGSVG